MPKKRLSDLLTDDDYDAIYHALDEFDVGIASFDDVLRAILKPLVPHFDQIRKELSAR
jgi:hypothetical protein